LKASISGNPVYALDKYVEEPWSINVWLS